MPQINSGIFKSYDVRGIYPSELNEDAAYEIGRAIVNKTGAKKVLVGRDMRLSGEVLQRELIRGINDAGADVHDIGLVPVDFIYWAVPEYGYEAGVVVTASHNPKEYNGFKMVKAGGDPVRGKEIAEAVEAVAANPPSGQKGKTEKADYWDAYIAHITAFAKKLSLKRMKIVVDAGNGMAGSVMPRLAAHLPVDIVPLFYELDGNFPNRPPNPLMPHALDQLASRVRDEHADFGAAFDADSDRLFLVDEKGAMVQGDMTLLMLAKEWLSQEQGAKIGYNVICSHAVPELIREWGGTPLRTPVGYVNGRQAIKAEGGVMYGEVSGHFCFRDNYYGDCGYLALILIMGIYSKEGKPLSKLVEGLRCYCRGDEVNFRVTDQRRVMEALEKHYSDAKIDKLDGITFEYPDWWFNVRPSNTEPLLRVTVEGDACDIMEARRKEITEMVTRAS